MSLLLLLRTGVAVPIEFTEDFEGAANTVPATTSTTSFTGAQASAALTHSTIRSITGTTSLRILNPAATTALYMALAPARTLVYQRVYFYAADYTNGTTLMGVQTGGTLLSNIQAPVSASAFRLRDGTTVTATSTTPVTAGQWYRLEHFADLAGGTHRLRIFTGANLHGTTPDEELSGAVTTGTFDRLQLGTNAANTLDWFFDAYASGTSTWIGPAAVGPTTQNATAALTAASTLVAAGTITGVGGGAIALRGTPTTAEAAGSTALVNNVPAATVDGDLLLWSIDNNNNATISPPPAGWTSLLERTSGGACYLYVWYRIAASEPASYSTGTRAATGRVSGIMSAYSGVDQTTPLDVTAPAGIAGTTTTTAPAITPTTSGAWVLGFAAGLTGTAIANGTYTSSNTTIDSSVTSTSASTNVVTTISHVAWTSGAVTPLFTATQATTRSVGATAALRPAAGGGPITQDATAALTATSTLTVVATIEQVVAASLVATSTLTAAVIRQPEATAALTATSTLTAVAVRQPEATAALTATSTLSATVVREPQAAASLTATSTLTATADRTAVLTATLTAASTLTAVGTQTGAQAATANLVATSTLTVTAVRQPQATVSLTTTATLTAIAVREQVAPVALVATATLSVTAVVIPFPYTEPYTGIDNTPWPAPWQLVDNSGGQAEAKISGNQGYLHSLTATHAPVTMLLNHHPLADQEVACDVTMGDATDDFAVVLRASTAVDSGVRLTVTRRNDTWGWILEVGAPLTAPTVLDSNASFLTNPSIDMLKLRYQVTGTAVRVRLWDPAGAEPGGWTADTTQAVVSAAGYVGVTGNGAN